jgi:phosphatidylinositol alpha 1,6-mannosyltransferase
VGPIPRVAFFTDTFTEINGVALTSRQLTAFAQRRGYAFLCVRGADRSRRTDEYATTHVELARGRFAFSLDKGLRHDPMLWRHQGRVAAAVREFKPDIIHVVSPGDVSEIGVYTAKQMNLPLAISWHTNLHEFGAMRLARMLRWQGVSRLSEKWILEAVIRFYQLADVLYAPNEELVEMLERRTGKPVFLMKRGIDTELFNPSRRTVNDVVLRLGYVGRITPEKNVLFLRDLEAGLRAAGVPPFRFLIVGDGSERDWLRQNLAAADLPGILRGEQLAEAYANMDVFTFPSRTDTFGNVVLEAFASGTPAVVTDAGGPKFIVREGVSGFVARTESEFIERTARLLRSIDLRARMGEAAREQASGESWDTVFEKVYDGYGVAIEKAGILQRFTAR